MHRPLVVAAFVQIASLAGAAPADAAQSSIVAQFPAPNRHIPLPGGLDRPPAPTALGTTTDAKACGAHNVFPLLCRTLVESGGALLTFAWNGNGRYPHVDGYRAYRSVGTKLTLLNAPKTDETATAIFLDKSQSGPGTCVVVTAYKGSVESAPTPALCLGSGAVAHRDVLTPLTVRNVALNNVSDSIAHWARALSGTTNTPISNLFAVGLETSSHGFERWATGLSYDFSPYANRKILRATLSMSVDTTENTGSHTQSCLENVGTGTARWWEYPGGIEYVKGVDAARQGPDIAIEVTSIVRGWQNGGSNFGFVLLPPETAPYYGCLTFYRRDSLRFEVVYS